MNGYHHHHPSPVAHRPSPISRNQHHPPSCQECNNPTPWPHHYHLPPHRRLLPVAHNSNRTGSSNDGNGLRGISPPGLQVCTRCVHTASSPRWSHITSTTDAARTAVRMPGDRVRPHCSLAPSSCLMRPKVRRTS